MTNDSAIRDLRSKVLALCNNTAFSDVEFVEWLTTYAKRGDDILNPPDNAVESAPTADALRSFRRFANNQRVTDFCLKHNLQLKHGSFWWYLSDERPGHVWGLEARSDEAMASRGIARLTDGIQLWIERADGSLFLGHREWWRKDRKQSGNAAKIKKDVVKVDKPLTALEQFLMS